MVVQIEMRKSQDDFLFSNQKKLYLVLSLATSKMRDRDHLENFRVLEQDVISVVVERKKYLSSMGVLYCIKGETTGKLS